MEQDILFRPVPLEKFDLLTREEIIALALGEQDLRRQMEREVRRLTAINEELKQKTFLFADQIVIIKNKLFGKSSERSPKEDTSDDDQKPSKAAKTRVLLPSQRYPDAQLIERRIQLEVMPACKCCGSKMLDSGMTEDSEYLTVVPEQYIVIRQMRHKYRCGKCHGDVQTAPNPPKIKSGSSYSDEMTVDVALTKYCDLIPIERYSSIAGRAGLEDLPPQSLIEMTHSLADFVKPVYSKLKDELITSKLLFADETPHRMLEGDKKCRWFLWGFSSRTASYFECHDTRSGDVASHILINSKCEFLSSDVFSGYGKGVRDTNEIRKKSNLPLIRNIYCNAHARRKFNDAKHDLKCASESKVFTNFYRKIYHLESEAKDKPPDEILRIRAQMKPIFKQMHARAMAEMGGYSDKSLIGRAMRYFLKNYEEFTYFIQNPDLPIDNNQQERLLRNPVIGRKTWYGTHSKRGAETSAILFSLVESCKLNGVNPRTYFKQLVQDIHQGKPVYTPSQFKLH